MTKKQYEQLKRAARRDAIDNQIGIGSAREGDYVVLYSTHSGYYASNNPIISRRSDFYGYVRSCRILAQLNPGTSAKELADARAFLEVYKK